MPAERPGPLDLLIDGQPYKLATDPQTKKPLFKAEEVDPLNQRIGSGPGPNYGDFPAAVESVIDMDNWTAGLSKTRAQTDDDTYWFAKNIDARRPHQLTLAPNKTQVLGAGSTYVGIGSFTDQSAGPIKFVDFGTAPYMLAGRFVWKYQAGAWAVAYDANSLNPGATGNSGLLGLDLVAFNNLLLASFKTTGLYGGATTDQGSGGTVTYSNGGGGGVGLLTDTSKSWGLDHKWQGRLVFAGGQTNVVADNSGTVLTMAYPWTVIPTAGAAYTIDAYQAYVWSANGLTWNYVDPRANTSVDTGRADLFAVVRFQLWKAVVPNKIYSSTNPTAAPPDWQSTPSQIGEQTRLITSLAPYVTDIAVGKEDGLWTLDRNGNDYPLLPDLATVADLKNCSGLKQWRGGLMFRVRNGFWRYTEGRMDSVGLDHYRATGAVGSALVLSVADVAPSINECFVALRRADSGMGTYIASLHDDPFRWHMIYHDPSQLPSSVGVTAKGNPNTPTLWIGAFDGTGYLTNYLLLPAATDNPLDDSTYLYAQAGSITFCEQSPLPDQDKTWSLLRLRLNPSAMPPMPPYANVGVEYAADDDIDTATFRSLWGPNGEMVQRANLSYQEWFFPKPLVAKSIQLRLWLYTKTGGADLNTPVVRHLVLHYKHRPQARLRFEADLICEDNPAGALHYVSKRTADEQLADLLLTRTNPSPVTLVHPLVRNGKPESKRVMVEKVSYELLEQLPGNRHRWRAKVIMLEDAPSFAPLVPPADTA